MEMECTTFTLEKNAKRELKKAAAKRGLTMASMIRETILEFLDREKMRRRGL